MTLLRNLNHFISLFLETFRQFGRWRIWAVLAAYFALQWLILYAHFDFVSPAFYGFVKAWLGLAGALGLISGQEAAVFTHYPGQFLVLPSVFGWARLLIGVLIEGLVLGYVAVLFRNIHLQSAGESALDVSATVRFWLQLALAWVALNGLILLVNIFLPELLQTWLRGSPRRREAFEFIVLPVVQAFLFGLLYFAIPSVAIYGENVVKGIGRSVRIFFRRPFTSFFLAAAILFAPTLVASIANRSADIITKFRPELVYWVLAAGLVLELIAYFFWMGTATRYLYDTIDE